MYSEYITLKIVGCGSRASILDTDTCSDTTTLASRHTSKASGLEPCTPCRYAPSTDCRCMSIAVPVAAPDIISRASTLGEDVDPRNTLGQTRGEQRSRKRTSKYYINTTIEIESLCSIEHGKNRMQYHLLTSRNDVDESRKGILTRDIFYFPHPSETIQCDSARSMTPSPLEL